MTKYFECFILIFLVLFLFARSARTWNHFSEVNELIPCCPNQSIFKNGTCELDLVRSASRKNLEYPAGFRNWTTNFTLQCESGYSHIDVDIISGGIVIWNGQLFKISNDRPYCIDSVGEHNHVLKMIICQITFKCASSGTCTKKCCPPNSFLIQSTNPENKNNKTNSNGNLRCGRRGYHHGHSFDYNSTMIIASPGNSNLSQLIVWKQQNHVRMTWAIFHFDLHIGPNAKIFPLLTLQVQEDGDGSTIILKKNPNHTVEIWLSLLEDDFCVDLADIDENPSNLVLLYCDEGVQEEIGKIQVLLKSFLQDKFAAAAKATGAISILSAIFLSLSLIVYATLWREHNTHGWIQFSFLLALFCTYFVAGLRRLIGYEALVGSGLASLFEALEDFGAVSASANLVAISFDLFLILWKSTPTFSKHEGLKQGICVIILSWTTGVIVMTAGLIIKSGKKYTIIAAELTNLKEYLPKLLEFFLCIQNDMLFSICLPIVQLGLFTLNLILFLGSAIVLYRRKVETQMAFENFAKDQVFKFWVQRFAKLFLLMGLWWPMIVICVFECNSMLKYTTKVWTQVLNTFYLKPGKVDFEIPWHLYLISNLLAFQAVVTSILFVCNRKTWNALKKTSPISRLCYENMK